MVYEKAQNLEDAVYDFKPQVVFIFMERTCAHGPTRI